MNRPMVSGSSNSSLLCRARNGFRRATKQLGEQLTNPQAQLLATRYRCRGSRGDVGVGDNAVDSSASSQWYTRSMVTGRANSSFRSQLEVANPASTAFSLGVDEPHVEIREGASRASPYYVIDRSSVAIDDRSAGRRMLAPDLDVFHVVRAIVSNHKSSYHYAAEAVFVPIELHQLRPFHGSV